MKHPTPEKLKRLPLWARQYIDQLNRTRDNVTAQLKEYQDSQTPSKVWTEDLLCDGQQTGPSLALNYFQSERLEIEHAGVRLCVNLYEDARIKLQWRPAGAGWPMGDVALIPESYQSARLVAKENMS